MHPNISSACTKPYLLRVVLLKCIPRRHAEAEKYPEKDAQQDISVVVHSQQHNHVGHRELHRIDSAADRLLWPAWPEEPPRCGRGGEGQILAPVSS